MGNGSCWKKKNKNKKENKEKKGREVSAPSAQELEEKKKVPWRSPAARSGDAIRVSAKDGESYAEIVKEMNSEADPLWTVQSTHSLSVPGGTLKERLSVVQWAHNSPLTRWSLSCCSLNKNGYLSSHSSPW